MLAIATHRQAVEIRDLGGTARPLSICEILLVVEKRKYPHSQLLLAYKKGTAVIFLSTKPMSLIQCVASMKTLASMNQKHSFKEYCFYTHSVYCLMFSALYLLIFMEQNTPQQVTDLTESWVVRINTQVLCAQPFFGGAVPFSHFAIQILRPPFYIFYHWSYSQDCQPFGSNFFFHHTDPQGELSLYSEKPNAKIYFFKLKLDPVVKLFRLHFEPPWTKSVEQGWMEYLWQYITNRISSRNSNLLWIGQKEISTMP